MAGDEFARVLAEAGEPPPADRPAGWADAAALASMREALAVHQAAVAARWAVNAEQRRRGREVYEAARRDAGLAGRGSVLPWMDGTPPAFWIL